MRVFTLIAFPPCQWITIHCNAACCQVGCHFLFDDVSRSLVVHVFAGTLQKALPSPTSFVEEKMCPSLLEMAMQLDPAEKKIVD